MIWVFTIFAVVAASYSVIATVEMSNLKKQLEHLSKRADSADNSIAQLAIAVSENKKKLEETQIDPIEQQVQEAKAEILSQWINSITSYNPYEKV